MWAIGKHLILITNKTHNRNNIQNENWDLPLFETDNIEDNKYDHERAWYRYLYFYLIIKIKEI